jgi:hypothetical protein
MKHLKKYQLFESITDDIFEKINKLRQDFDNGIKELKSEYAKAVSDCLHEITDDYDFQSHLIMGDNFTNDITPDHISILYTFTKIPVDKFDEFFEKLSSISDLVKSYVSEEKDIKPLEVCLLSVHKMEDFRHFNGCPLHHIKTWVDKSLKRDKESIIKSISVSIKI